MSKILCFLAFILWLIVLLILGISVVGLVTLIIIDEDSYLITLEDVDVMTHDMEGWLVANEGSLTVALDTEIDQELKQEGLAREFVNRIQNLRKNIGLQVTDRIIVKFSANKEISDAIIKLSDYVCNEILCTSCEYVEHITEDVHTLEIEQDIILVNITKFH